ncbi:MAG: AAA family ATPase, partial [Treponema sp.]|nr:AAA family ATPase [Treponema sp.]
MFLKSLEIFGFKSFADRTVINFADGITALLGPNGCGKSNVVDAIKWVLAENRSKNLRADAMESVVFNGTDDRAALGMAEVTLTISNENGLLPMPDDEIAIKRRYYKKNGGENEYFINGVQKTATEIRKLFMDTGVGKAAYSVMEQGKIDQILSSKPEDRRYLFEEAAGISRSKAEVLEAERELEKTRANLAQIDLGLNETKRSYETLKVQAEKTAKYRKLKDDRFNCELDIQLLKLKDFSLNKSKCEEQKKEAEEKRDAAAKEIEEIYSSLNENNDRVKALQDSRTVKEQEVIKIGAAQNGKRMLAQNFHKQKTGIKDKIGSIENSIRNIKDRIDDVNDEIDSHEADLHEKNRRLSDMSRNIDGFIENINQSSGQIDGNTKLIAANSGKIHNLDTERAKLEEALKGITEDIVTELDAKLKDAGYSSAANKKAKEELETLIEKIKIFAKGRSNIFGDFASLPSPSAKDSTQFAKDAVTAFTDLLTMLENLSACVENYTKTTPQFIDDFLSPEGIITKKREIDFSINDNLSRIEEIKKESTELEKTNAELQKRINEYRETLSELRVNQAKVSQEITSVQQQISLLKQNRVREENSLREKEEELASETRELEDLDEKIEEVDSEIAELEMQGQKITAELNKLDAEIADCNSKVTGKKEVLEKRQAERNKWQEKLEKLSIGLAQSDTEIRNVKQNFQDVWSRDLMEFEERMYKINTPSVVLREKLSSSRKALADLGSVNLMAPEEFGEQKERYEKLQKQYEDTVKARADILRVYEEIKTKSTEMFVLTYNKIKKNFHNMFRRLFGGGRAELRLTDPQNVLTSGVDIYAEPPGKKLQNIALLSGGEKTMTAVALLFATYQVRPSPFCLLDEIDAALDDKNVTSFVQALRSFAKLSQYIVITHNKKTVMGASTMLGVTMQESGVSKVITISLDKSISKDDSFDETEEFIEEDVPEEEGVVV